MVVVIMVILVVVFIYGDFNVVDGHDADVVNVSIKDYVS